MNLREPAYVDLHDRREGRWWRGIGVFLAGASLAIAAVIAIPALLGALSRADRRDREAACRGGITAVVQANTAQLIADQARSYSAVVRRGDNPLLDALDADVERQDRLAAIQVQAVSICHANPEYVVPAEVQP